MNLSSCFFKYKEFQIISEQIAKTHVYFSYTKGPTNNSILRKTIIYNLVSDLFHLSNTLHGYVHYSAGANQFLD